VDLRRGDLFTREYWEIGRKRLRPGGMFCQWVQLYGMGTTSCAGWWRTFLAVFPESRLFETIPGADVLLIGFGPPMGPPGDLPLAPRLSPNQLRWLAGDGWLNTDDDPRVEWSAPRWLHRDTGRSTRRWWRAAAWIAALILTRRPGCLRLASSAAPKLLGVALGRRLFGLRTDYCGNGSSARAPRPGPENTQRGLRTSSGSDIVLPHRGDARGQEETHAQEPVPCDRPVGLAACSGTGSDSGGTGTKHHSKRG